MRLHHITTQLLALAFAIPPAFAENQPDRQAPLRIVVSVPAGGVSDRVASPSGIATLSDLAPRHREGRLRILATSGAERSMLLPGLPTFREQGFETAQATGWHAVYGPAATPAQVIDRLSGAIVAALESPELRAKLVALGVEATGTTPEQLAAIMAADTAHWAPIIKAAGFNAPRQ
jgi:tripartite-type tricarboxylate transporter receptor subunit TctC